MGLKILTKTFFNSRFPLPPAAVKDGFKNGASTLRVPHGGTLIDEVLLNIGAISGHLTTTSTTTVWTVAETTIDASVDLYLGSGLACWYDSINDRMWVFGVNTNPAPDAIFTAYITLETGAVTNVGSVQISTQFSGTAQDKDICTVNRSSEDSGNFTLYFKDRTIVINESNGAEVSNSAALNFSNLGSYVTADGTIFIKNMLTAPSGDSYMIVSRSKRPERVNIPDRTISGNGAASTIQVIPWGTNVKLIATVGNVHGIQTFNKIEFDAWMAKLLDYAGIE